MRLLDSALTVVVSLATAAAVAAVPHPDEGPTHPFAVDYFGIRLAEAVAEAAADEGRRAEEEGDVANAKVSATNEDEDPPVVTCPEGFDDDATLAAIPTARQYGLNTCRKAHDLLVTNLGSADMLCVSMAAGVCNCTCAGTLVQPSVQVDAVPWGEAEDLGPTRDDAFDCADIVANDGGEKDARLLPDGVRGWKCHELGEVGVLLWDVDEEGETVTFAAEFMSAGGAASIGLSANGGMFGADLLWVGKDGESQDWMVKDMFSRGYSPNGDLVILDESQDATLIWSEESDGRLAFQVSRPIKSCDTEDDLEVVAGPLPILWARFSGHSHMYHGPSTSDRGTVYLDLLNPHDESIPENPEDLFTVDLRFLHGEDQQRYELEDGRVNSYVCRSFAVPNDRPYHIVAYEAILDTVPADANVVHHVVLYSCEEDPNLPDPHMCSAMNAGCYSVDIAWAVGIPTQYLPAVAGLPMGKFYYMEMHYENLAQRSSIVDGSGLRLTFTPQLREQDYGYIIVGSDLGRTPELEPNSDDVVRSGFCPSECTARALPADGVNVHAMFFHAHLAGRALRTQQVRDGIELLPMGEMPYYDFNHQFFKYASHEPKLMPGDELITTCRYSTAGTDGPTRFGLETRDEMCFNIVGVYPAIENMKFCWNQTEGGGRCRWGDDSLVTQGIVPYKPFVEDVPEQCSAADVAGDSDANGDADAADDSNADGDADAADDSNANSDSGVPDVRSSAAERTVSRWFVSALVFVFVQVKSFF